MNKLVMKSFLRMGAAFLLTLTVLQIGCGDKSTPPATGADPGTGAKSGRKKIAYVTNGVDPFWNTAVAGVRAAEKEFGIDCEVLMPPKGLVDQKRMLESLLARGIDGIAISPVDAKNQVDLLNQAAARCPLITHDSDAPLSKRLCFVGMENYKAGRAAGRLVKEAIPAGGKVMLFVGRLEQLNSQQRRQGVIDELLDRPMQQSDSANFDPTGKVLSGAKYTILDTRTDNFDYARAKANAQDAMASNSDLACMVGLFAYNAPHCLEAAKEAGRLGKIKIVSFDEAAPVLQGIIDGHVYGTISQQPYFYGYHSVRLLHSLTKGDKSVLPPNGFLEVPIVEVRQKNAQTFWADLKKMQDMGK
ncbi:MAG: sugar-binding protein [Verrucomicrobia bacterium]|nr:sugar-binding protein [Verrucomicrobiota bacterium]